MTFKAFGCIIIPLYQKTKRRKVLNDYNFGNFVCSLREKKGLTQADLARQLGVTPAAISKWENGSSKPRVEVLFQLAEILGVRSEELMAGHFIEEEHLDPESVKIINEKYEYLRRIELHNTPKTKIFRLIAWFIDWNIIGFAAVSATLFLMAFFKASSPSLSAPQALLILLMILSYPVCFVLRDLIFGGRSLGKRIMGLTVIDKKTGDSPKKISLFSRNIFLFIVHIDVVIMLITGLTLGDRASHTVVVRKSDVDLSNNVDIPEQNVEIINQYASNQKAREKSNKKNIVTWICIIAIVLILFVGFLLTFINIMLNGLKETEEYKLAYSYVIESDKFAEFGIDEDQLKFASYSANSYPDGQREAQIVFNASARQRITVILHDEGEGWYVCRDCTRFE